MALEVDAAVAVAGEVDTNPARVPSGVGKDDADAEVVVPVATDTLLRAQGQASARETWGDLGVRVDAALGLKLFSRERTERMTVGQLRGVAVGRGLPFSSTLTTYSWLKGRAQVSGVRSYTHGGVGSFIETPVFERVTLRGGVLLSGFHAFDNALFSWAGGSVQGGGRYFLTDAERVELLVDAGVRGYPVAPQDVNEPRGPRRFDVPITGSLQLISARTIFLAGGYTVMRNQSFSRGESWTRHRLNLLLGFRLPAEVTVATQGVLQLTSYDDGVSLGQSYFLGDDDESQNAFEVNLSRPLWGGLIAEARALFLGNELANEGARFQRTTLAVGLRAEL